MHKKQTCRSYWVWLNLFHSIHKILPYFCKGKPNQKNTVLCLTFNDTRVKKTDKLENKIQPTEEVLFAPMTAKLILTNFSPLLNLDSGNEAPTYTSSKNMSRSW